METQREIDRIYQAAEKTAEGRAAAYIAEKYGIKIISRLPFEIEDILCIRAGEETWSIDRGNSGIQTYRLTSEIYEVTEGSPDGSYATVMHVLAGYADQYEGPLYILSRNKETGKVEVRTSIASQEELDALPESESRRDYKIHFNGTYGMSAGYQYAVGEKIED